MATVMVHSQPSIEMAPRVRSLTLRQWMIAMLVLGLAFLVGLEATVGVTMMARTWSASAMTATALARDKIEWLKASGTAHRNLLPHTVTEDYRSIAAFPQFKRHITLQFDTPAPHLITVTVNVLWDHDARSIQLRTILAE